MDNRTITEIIFAVIAVVVFICTFVSLGAMTRADFLKKVMQLVNVITQAVTAADDFYDMTNEQRYKYVADQAALEGVILPPLLVQYIIEGVVEIVHRTRDKATNKIQ